MFHNLSQGDDNHCDGVADDYLDNHVHADYGHEDLFMHNQYPRDNHYHEDANWKQMKYYFSKDVCFSYFKSVSHDSSVHILCKCVCKHFNWIYYISKQRLFSL